MTGGPSPGTWRRGGRARHWRGLSLAETGFEFVLCVSRKEDPEEMAALRVFDHSPELDLLDDLADSHSIGRCRLPSVHSMPVTRLMSSLFFLTELLPILP